jgi:hypothetical protein
MPARTPPAPRAGPGSASASACAPKVGLLHAHVTLDLGHAGAAQEVDGRVLQHLALRGRGRRGGGPREGRQAQAALAAGPERAARCAKPGPARPSQAQSQARCTCATRELIQLPCRQGPLCLLRTCSKAVSWSACRCSACAGVMGAPGCSACSGLRWAGAACWGGASDERGPAGAAARADSGTCSRVGGGGVSPQGAAPEQRPCRGAAARTYACADCAAGGPPSSAAR